jgi:fluoride exporter
MLVLSWARLNERVFRRLDVVIAVLAGGCAGGAARYATVRAWPTGSSGFPWATLSVNLAGAAVLGALVVLAGTVWRSRYARPLLGTGFCGAFTTFSAVVVDVDRLLARGEAGVALGYLAASFLGGLVAAFVGIVTARAAVQWRPAVAAEREI